MRHCQKKKKKTAECRSWSSSFLANAADTCVNRTTVVPRPLDTPAHKATTGRKTTEWKRKTTKQMKIKGFSEGFRCWYVLNRYRTRSEMSHGITMVGFFGINLHESIQLKESSERSSYTDNIWVASSFLQHASMWSSRVWFLLSLKTTLAAAAAAAARHIQHLCEMICYVITRGEGLVIRKKSPFSAGVSELVQ